MKSVQAPVSITELHEQQGVLRQEMEMAAQAFIRSTQSFLEGELRKSVLDAVTTRHELSRRLGTEGLRPLKRELEELVGGRDSAAIFSRLNDDSLWPHRSGNFNHSNGTYSHYRTSTVSPLPVELSRSIGDILKLTTESLLTKHGFAFVPSGQVQSEEMMDAFRHYSDLYYRCAECERDLRHIEASEGKAEAKRLWETA